MDFESRINGIKGKGQPLSSDVRAFYEDSFGVDFSPVRIHKGADAAEAASTINANAFTNGYDIVFNSDKYSPESQAGKSLLAHELTHVVQQNEDCNAQISEETSLSTTDAPDMVQSEVLEMAQTEVIADPTRLAARLAEQEGRTGRHN